MFGDEETPLIAPGDRRLPGRSDRRSGPYPPDTIFDRAYRGEFDVVVP